MTLLAVSFDAFETRVRTALAGDKPGARAHAEW